MHHSRRHSRQIYRNCTAVVADTAWKHERSLCRCRTRLTAFERTDVIQKHPSEQIPWSRRSTRQSLQAALMRLQQRLGNAVSFVVHQSFAVQPAESFPTHGVPANSDDPDVCATMKSTLSEHERCTDLHRPVAGSYHPTCCESGCARKLWVLDASCVMCAVGHVWVAQCGPATYALGVVAYESYHSCLILTVTIPVHSQLSLEPTPPHHRWLETQCDLAA